MRRVLVVAATLSLVAVACGGGTAAPTASQTAAAGSQAARSAAPGALDADTAAKAKAEGQVTVYTSLSSDDAKAIGEAFNSSPANPGIKATMVRKSSEDLVTQFMTEVKAGKILADVLETGGMDLAQPLKAGYLVEFRPPAAAGFPAELKDANGMWTAARLGIETISYNTTLVSAADAPHSFEDALNPKWKGKLLIEQSDIEVMLGLAIRKYGNDDAKLTDYFTKLAANGKPFKGHTETLDLLIAGQGALFWGGHAHTAEQRRAAGAPVDYMRDEAVVTIDGPGLVKGAAHPNAGKFFINWYLGDEGAKALGARSRVPARPGAANARMLPQKAYYTGPTLADQFKKYSDLWNKLVLGK